MNWSAVLSATGKFFKQVGWWTYAVLATILTLGYWLRIHHVTRRIKTMGGVRAGLLGGIHVYTDRTADRDFVVLSTWHGKQRWPVNQIALTETHPLSVSMETTGGKSQSMGTWHTRTVAGYVDDEVNKHRDDGRKVAP